MGSATQEHTALASEVEGPGAVVVEGRSEDSWRTAVSSGGGGWDLGEGFLEELLSAEGEEPRAIAEEGRSGKGTRGVARTGEPGAPAEGSRRLGVVEGGAEIAVGMEQGVGDAILEGLALVEELDRLQSRDLGGSKGGEQASDAVRDSAEVGDDALQENLLGDPSPPLRLYMPFLPSPALHLHTGICGTSLLDVS